MIEGSQDYWKATRDELPDNLVDLGYEEQGQYLEEFIFVRYAESRRLRWSSEPYNFSDDPFLKYQWISEFLRQVGLTKSVRPSMREIDLVRGMMVREYKLSRYELRLYFLPANLDGAGNREIFGFSIWDFGGTCQRWAIVKEEVGWVQRPTDYLIACKEMGIQPHFSS